jgi:NAD(P)-dependent dehydrogenase (short-subunit alcohol dehydrogenase family)
MLHSLFDLRDRIAVVSGAARGLGRAMAEAVAEAGAEVVLVDRNLEGAEQTAAAVEKLGRRAQPVRCDVSDPEQIRDLFNEVDRSFGRIDVLGNVAGDGILGRAEELTLEQVQQVLQNLVVSRFCCCQEAGRRMLAAGKGSIINIGSLASITALGRGHAAYSMAMGAVAQMTRELSTEWSSRGVRVNAILPAQVINPGLTQRMHADPNLEATFLRGIPIGRLGQPDDIKGLAVFLASDASAWITGALIPMDGGNLAMNAGGSVPKR